MRMESIFLAMICGYLVLGVGLLFWSIARSGALGAEWRAAREENRRRGPDDRPGPGGGPGSGLRFWTRLSGRQLQYQKFSNRRSDAPRKGG